MTTSTHDYERRGQTWYVPIVYAWEDGYPSPIYGHDVRSLAFAKRWVAKHDQGDGGEVSEHTYEATSFYDDQFGTVLDAAYKEVALHTYQAGVWTREDVTE